MRIAILLVSLASFATSAPAVESQRVAVDASEIRTDFPQLFKSDRVVAELKPKSLAGAPVGLYSPADYHSSGQVRGLSASGLHYDPVDRHISYPQAREYMPKFEGLVAESVSLRRDSIRFKYSFR